MQQKKHRYTVKWEQGSKFHNRVFRTSQSVYAYSPSEAENMVKSNTTPGTFRFNVCAFRDN